MTKKPTKPTIEDKLNITEMQETLNFIEKPPLLPNPCCAFVLGLLNK